MASQYSPGDDIVTIAEGLSILGALIAQYGLPLAMVIVIIWASANGWIIWRHSHDAIIAALVERHTAVVQVMSDRLKDTSHERDRLFDIAVPAVKAVETGADAVREMRKGS